MNAVALAPTAGFELQETASLDLKSDFDPTNSGEWCELLKDIVAMANSGGGRIIIGLTDDGTPTGIDSGKIRAIDPAIFVDKVFSYTGVHFAGVTTQTETHAETLVAVLVIGEAPVPMIFNKTGNYQTREGKQRNAFNPGTLYLRHGAKSEPATSDDMRDILDRQMKRARESLLSNLRQVVEAPAGAIVSISTVSAPPSDLATRGVRLVHDPAAASAAMLDPNITHPHRQKEVVAKVNAHLSGRGHVTSNDIVAIRRIYKTEDDLSLCYRPKYASCQYSDLFVQWVISHIESDQAFLTDLRQRYHDFTVTRNAACRQARSSKRAQYATSSSHLV
jgi:hypothetical protein